MADIATLKDELAAAQTAEKLAKQRTADAAAALQAAINADSGIIGHVLQFTKDRGWGARATRMNKRILVDRISTGWRGEPEAHGKYIIASGEIGSMRGQVEISKATDLGPYAALTQAGTL